MNTEEQIELISHWLEDTNNIPFVPKRLVKHISENDADRLLAAASDFEGENIVAKLRKMYDRLAQQKAEGKSLKFKERELSLQQKTAKFLEQQIELNKKQAFFNFIIALTGLFVAFGTLLSAFKQVGH